MPRSFFISVYVLISFVALSQTGDTLYFNKSWKPCSKKEYSFFRLVQEAGGVYTIRDYYKTGVLQMQASAISAEPEVLHGSCTYYHSNEITKTKGSYDHGKPEGTWIHYHSNGNIKAKGNCEKGKLVGLWDYYNSKGEFTESYDYDYNSEKNIRANDSIRRIKNKIPLSAGDNKFSIALRGKLFGFFVIEDSYFSTATLGVEFLMKGRHSLGVDFTYFGWQYEDDDNEENPLYSNYERRTYLYLDYKYKFLAYRNFDFYFNLYDKIGTYHTWNEGIAEGYTFWEKPFLNNKEDGTFNQVGAGIGFKKYADGGRFYVDLSANIGRLFSNNDVVKYNDSLQVIDTQYHVKTDRNIFYMRLNLGCKLFVKK